MSTGWNGFTIQASNVARVNEKGRVERLIRDLKAFLRVTSVASLQELDARALIWKNERNSRVHRTTGRQPTEMLAEEKLRPLP